MVTEADINWNGFFTLKSIKNIKTLKQFYKDALVLSKDSRVDILRSWTRERYNDITPEEYIEKNISLSCHNVCIDRWICHNYANWASKEGEIGSSTYSNPSLFLFIFLELEDFYLLVEKYHLEHLK